MKILFMSGGQRELALRHLLENGEQVVAVITPRITNENRRFEKVVLTAIEFGIPVFPVTRKDMSTHIDSIDFDILVSCGFPYRIERHIIEKAKYAINVHPTLLPQYRGFRSGPYIILNNEKQTGTTIHFLTEGMDKGDIILQKAFNISIFDTARSIFRKNKEIEPELLLQVISMIKKGEIESYPQDESKASEYTYIRTPKDSEIDWNKPLRELYNGIRACDPDNYPAFFYIDGHKVCIKLWRPDKTDEEEDMI